MFFCGVAGGAERVGEPSLSGTELRAQAGPQRSGGAEVASALRAEAKEGRIACAAAMALASRLGVSPREVGLACDRLGLKIVSCQLGCFGRR